MVGNRVFTCAAQIVAHLIVHLYKRKGRNETPLPDLLLAVMSNRNSRDLYVQLYYIHDINHRQ